MSAATQLASRLREVILNGTWIVNTNYKDQLTHLDWKTAVTKVHNLNTIAMLTFHIHYYIAGMLKVLEGGPLAIHDKYSFDMPLITSQQEWESLLSGLWNDTEKFAALVEQMNDVQLEDVFVDARYGTYQRNIDAMIEHAYYHLGQIVLIRKITENANR